MLRFAPGFRAESVDTNDNVSLVCYAITNANALVGQSRGKNRHGILVEWKRGAWPGDQ